MKLFNNKSSTRSDSGFSLAELLIYIGIVGVVSGMLVGILSTVTKTQVQESAKNEVTDQLNFVMSTIQRLVRDSSLIELNAGTATSTLELRMNTLANDPTLVYLSGGQVYVQQGTGAAQSISSDKVNIDSLQFKKFSQAPGKDIVQVDLSISEVQQAGGQTISRALRSAFARVNAAVFDSDLLPNIDNTYNIGASPSTRWLNGAFSGNVTMGGNLSVGTATGPTGGVATFNGNVGIGTTAPSYRLEVSGGGLKVASSSVFENAISVGTTTAPATLAYVSKIASNGTVSSIGASTSTFANWFAEWITSEAPYGFSSGGQGTTGGYAAGWFARPPAAGGSDNDVVFYSPNNIGFYNVRNGCVGNPCISGYQILSSLPILSVDTKNSRVGIGTSTPSEALEVDGNIRLSSTTAYKVTNLAAPTADSDAATKAYVDAAAGGGTLSVYASDGTTLLGKYMGTLAPIVPNTTTATVEMILNKNNSQWLIYSETLENLCDLIYYTSNSTNAITHFNNGDCSTAITSGTWYYSSTDCSGDPISKSVTNVAATFGSNIRSSHPTGMYRVSKNYNQVARSSGEDSSSNCTGFSYNSYRTNAGSCTTASGSGSGCYDHPYVISTRACGTGECQIK